MPGKWYKQAGLLRPKNREYKNCLVCKEQFLTLRPNQKYCGKGCKKTYNRYSETLIVASSGTVGAIAELLVSADLMKQGYEVYRALSPSSSCDILAVKDNKSYKFEIRTGRYKLPNNLLTYPTKNIYASNLAIVTFIDNKIHYIPNIFI